MSATAAQADGQPPLWRNSDFLRFFAGRFVTNAGDSLYSIATMWLVHDLSGSTVLTGVASALLLLPYVLQIIAGPVVDRLPLKPVLVTAQVSQAVIILTLPLAAYTGQLSVALIFLTVPVLSLLATLLAPAQSSLLPRIVADSQLSKGNSALKTITIGLDMIFDALGGLLIAAVGTTALFVLDSATFAVAAILFAGMGIPSVDPDRDDAAGSALGTYLADLREGTAILRGTVFVPMIAIAAVANFAMGVTLAILPAVGDQLGGPAIYGLLLGGLGIGRLFGSVVAPTLERLPYGKVLAATYLGGAVLWAGAVVVPSTPATVCLFGLAHATAGIDSVLTATLNQKVFPADVLGRVSAIKGTASMVTLPVGSLTGGFIAATLGPLPTFGLAAAGFGFMGLCFATRASLRGLPPLTDVDPAAFAIRTEEPE